MNTPIKLSSRLVVLLPGFYLVRPKSRSEFPIGLKIALYPSPVGDGSISFAQGGPAQPVAFLQRPGDQAIAHVNAAPATLLVVDYQRADTALGAPVEIVIQPITGEDLARLAPAVAQNDQSEQRVAYKPAFLPVRGLMLGGKQFEAKNGIVGSPGATEQITTFAIDPKALPPGVDLAYACKKHGVTEHDVATAGKMVGLGKESFPITAVCFMANQPEGGDYELKGHVVFAGHPPSAIVQGIELSGPTGCEALVALRVAFVKRSDQPGSPPKTSVWNDPAVLKSKAPRPQKGPKAVKE